MITCWIITEHGLIGTENQCRGVAAALGRIMDVTPEIKRIGLRQPWKALSPWLGFECARTFTGDELAAPWPDLVIASGRKAIAAARYIRKRSKGTTKTVLIQDPRIHPRHFDLVAVPHHDKTRGRNVLVTDAACNLITPDRLAEGREQFAALLDSIRKPRVAVLIGGNSRTHKLTAERMDVLCTQLRALSTDYGLMITASRRTGDENKAKLAAALAGTDAYIWDGTGDNPYMGFMGGADYILVTADSVSMISEAASTGTPAYLIELEGGSKRFARFYAHLLGRGVIRRFEGTLAPYDYIPLNDAARVAEAVKTLMQK